VAYSSYAVLVGGFELYREERAKTARLKRQIELLPRLEIRQMLDQMATILRHSAERMQLRFGQEAMDIYTDAIHVI